MIDRSASDHESHGADPRRRGSALVASLLVVMVIAGLGVCLIRLHSASTRRQVHSVDRKRALYVAEAGLSEAYLALAQGKSGNVGTQQVPAAFGDGVYWVQAEPTEDGNVTLTSTGLCGVGRFSISVVMRPQVNPIASLGVFSQGSLVVEPGVLIDGYESDSGTYDEQVLKSGFEDHTGGGAILTSNGDVWFEGSGAGDGGLPAPLPGESDETEVWGEVHPGPQGSALIDPGVFISGSTTPTNHYVVVPEIEVPAEVPDVGELTIPTDTVITITRRQAHVEALTVQAGASLALVGPLSLVIDRLHVESDGLVHFDTSSGPVMLIVTEHLDFAVGSRTTNATQDPAAVALLVSASEEQDWDGDGDLEPPIQFAPLGVFFGFLYAPHAAVSIPGSARVFGAVAAQDLTLQEGARLTVDRTMMRKDVGAGSMPQLIAWQIVDLPDSPLVRVKVDPRSLLSMQGVTPTPSADAHKETSVDIQYFDNAGKLQTYTGAAAGFDWGQVGLQVAVSWN